MGPVIPIPWSDLYLNWSIVTIINIKILIMLPPCKILLAMAILCITMYYVQESLRLKLS